MPPPDQIFELIKERLQHPTTARELARLLRVPREERVAFKRQLNALVHSVDLVQIRGNRFGLPEKEDVVAGRLQTNPAGFGFVVPEQGAGRKPGGILQVPARALVRRVLSRVDQRGMNEHKGDVPLVAFRTADRCLFMGWRYELHHDAPVRS